MSEGTELPTLPDTFDGVADGELGQLETELQAWFDTARDTAPIDELRTCRASIDQIRAEAQTRIDAAGERDREVAELSASFEQPAAPETPAVPAAVPAPPAVPAAEPTPVVAAAAPAAVTPPPLVAGEIIELTAQRGGRFGRARDRAPRPDAIRPPTTIVAAGGIPNVNPDTELTLTELARAVVRRWESLGINHGGNAFSQMKSPEKILVASVQGNYPEDRYLRQGQEGVNAEKISAVNSLESITAAGGSCVPLEPYYDIMTVAEAIRPVRDGVGATFQVDRGGLQIVASPQLSDLAAAVGFVTNAVDAAALGGNAGQIAAATKPVLHVTCPGTTSVTLNAITRILEFGNFGARAYPEQVTAWLALAVAQWARRAETALLDQMSANSTQVTATGTVGAARALVTQIIRAGAYYRNHQRMSVDRPLRVMLPAWVIDLMVADLTLGSGYETEFFAMARQQIVDALAELDINVTFYVDSGTGKNQLINNGAVQAAGASVTFPSTAVWYLFAEGTFLFMDGGTLDFNIWRDSQTNALNNFRMGAESFENLAFVGVESLEVTSTIAANGTAAGPAYGSSTVAAPVAIPAGL